MYAQVSDRSSRPASKVRVTERIKKMDKTLAYLATLATFVFAAILGAGTLLMMKGLDPAPLFSFFTATVIGAVGFWNGVKLKKVEKNTNGHLSALARKAGITPMEDEQA